MVVDVVRIKVKVQLMEPVNIVNVNKSKGALTHLSSRWIKAVSGALGCKSVTESVVI